MKTFAAAVALVAAASLTTVASADTLKLTGTSSQVVDNVYVYPYYFSVNGSPSSTSLMCMDYNREVTVGEQWNVSVQNIGSYTGTNASSYRAEAWLFSQLGSYSNSDVQFAAWDIFDDADVKNQSGFDSTAQSLVQQAMAQANNSSLISSGFFNKYQIYVPTTDQTGWTKGTPQEFVGTAVTPEPSSLALLGTGLVGVGNLLRRRNRRA